MVCDKRIEFSPSMVLYRDRITNGTTQKISQLLIFLRVDLCGVHDSIRIRSNYNDEIVFIAA